MEKPVISPDFTIEDIHKIREYNYEVTKNMTLEEKLAYYNTAGMDLAQFVPLNISKMKNTAAAKDILYFRK